MSSGGLAQSVAERLADQIQVTTGDSCSFTVVLGLHVVYSTAEVCMWSAVQQWSQHCVAHNQTALAESVKSLGVRHLPTQNCFLF